MASRGRGRGRGRGGYGQPPVHVPQGPPETFPTMEMPMPAVVTAEEQTLLEHKKALKDAWMQSAFFMQLAVDEKPLERYSSVYQRKVERPRLQDATIAWQFMPAELQGRQARRIVTGTEDLLQTIDKLEARAGNQKDKEKDEEDEENIEMALEDQDDGEDENDYVDTYFDNGEGEHSDGDGGDDGAVY